MKTPPFHRVGYKREVITLTVRVAIWHGENPTRAEAIAEAKENIMSIRTPLVAEPVGVRLRRYA